jgi:CcmD family protein
MKIIVSVSFLVVLGLFLFSTQVPITLTSDEIAKAVSEAGSEFPVDEEVLERAMKLSVEKLEKGQSTRLKYLASAYFVIWLVFMLYVLRLGQQQQALDKRLAQLEQTSDDPPSTPDEE